MKKYTLKSLENNGDILYVTIVPKEDKDKFSFTPGQYAAIGFKGTSGRSTPMRCFSIVSSANNSSQLSFTIRLGGQFTTALCQQETGSEVFVQGPFGNFNINGFYDKQIVLMAGGIGITPFMSMIRSYSENHDAMPITLLYSYRSGHNIPFQAELEQLSEQNSHFRLYTFVTGDTNIPNSPKLLSGKMTEKHLRQFIEGVYSNSTYFVCGPKGFSDSTISMLKKHGVSDTRIMSESFTQSANIKTKNGKSVRRLTYSFSSVILFLGIGFVIYLGISRSISDNNFNASSTNQRRMIGNGERLMRGNDQPFQHKYQLPLTSVS
jgi:ferredoxin-NADP reductase